MRVRGFRLWLIRGLLMLLAVIILLPMFQTFLYSFSSIQEMKAYMKTRGNRDEAEWMDPHLSPHMLSLGQYEQILVKDTTILWYFINSALYAAAILLGQALVLPALAFGLSRFRFHGREAIFFAIVMLMLLPFQVTMVPNVLTLRTLGLLDTVWAVILPMCFAPFYVFLLRQYMIALPDELLEAHREAVLGIPIRTDHVRSLNLSTAAGIAVYWALGAIERAGRGGGAVAEKT